MNDTWSFFLRIVCQLENFNVVIIICAIACAIFLWCMNRHFVQRRVSSTSLFYFSIVVFLLGVAVYTTGAIRYGSDSIFDALYAVPIAILSSVRMFLYQNSVGELSEAARGNSIFMGIYGLVHFMAGLIVAFVMLRLLGMRLEYWWRLRTFAHSDRLYVFWGIGAEAFALAKSISEKEKSPHIVFVNVVEDEADEKSAKRIFDMIKIKVNIDEDICDMGATLVNCYEDISDSSVCQEQTLDAMVRNRAKLKDLAKAIRGARELHLFFLIPDEENRNINSACNVVKLIESEQKGKSTGRKNHVYCHARNSAKTQNLALHDIVKYGTEPSVHIVDSSALAVANLKNSVDDCPVSLVDIDSETATITSAFRAIIIGYGEIGEDTLDFLYEFGAFVGKDGRKSPFHCTVIDRKASRLEGDFYAKSPAFRENSDTLKTLNLENEISFREYEIGSVEYWNEIEKEIRLGVNYIMVAINDDDLGLATARNLCEKCFYLQEGNDRAVKIYLKCASQENYEQLCANVDAMNGRYGKISLKVFGSIGEVFNYTTIIDDINMKRAKKYNWEYANHEVSGELEASAVKQLGHPLTEAEERELCWIEQIKLLRHRQKTSICDIDDSVRRRDQNISNSLHAKTKMYILEKAGMGKCYWNGKNLDRRGISYLNLAPQEKQVLVNLSKTEHERWVASSVLHGWQTTESSTDDKNPRTKRHCDIRPWAELRSEGQEREEVQGYDCGVVDTTIKLALQE